jgi:hypothetical protein
MRARARGARAAVLCAALLAGCDGTYLVVTVDSAQPLVLTALDVEVANAGQVGHGHFTHGASFTIPHARDLALQLDGNRSGAATVTAHAIGASGELASASGVVALLPGSTARLPLLLLAPGGGDGGNGPADLAATGGDACGDACGDDPCANWIKDPNEAGIDCGGVCPLVCAGAPCQKGADCVTGRCDGVCVPASGPPSWLAGPHMSTPRYLTQCALGPDGRIYVVGGNTGLIEGSDTVESLDPGGSWLPGPSLLTGRRDHAVLAGRDGTLYAVGGHDTFGGSLSSVEALTPGASVWAARAALPGSHSTLGGTVFSDGRLMVCDLDHCYLFVPPTPNQWTTIGAATVGRTAIGATIASDQNAYVVGGLVYGSPNSVRAEVDAYSPWASGWSPRAPLKTARQYAGTVAAPDGRIYAVSGDGNAGSATALSSVEVYSLAADRWFAAPSLVTARWGAAVCLGDDGRIYVAGGRDGNNTYDSVEIYGPVIHLSSALGPAGTPVVVGASNFAAGARIAAWFDKVLVARATTDASGVATLTVPVPPGVGPHTITVEDIASQYPVVRDFDTTP